MKIKHLLLGFVMVASCTTKSPIKTSESAPLGVQQAAALWTAEDGTQEDFDRFVEAHYCTTDSARLALFESLSRIFEQVYQSADMLTVELLRPTQLTNAASPEEPDLIMSGYSPLAHFSDDMFANKLAFITIINFPHYSLEEKNRLGKEWTRQEWAFVRMGDVFTTRVPAEVKARMAQALADAENYIADYNIYMGNLRTEDGRQLWDSDKILLQTLSIIRILFGSLMPMKSKKMSLIHGTKRYWKSRVPISRKMPIVPLHRPVFSVILKKEWRFRQRN